MRTIEYTFENNEGQEVTVKAEYTIVPFRETSNNSFPEDEIEVFNVTENGQEIQLEDEILTELIDYIRDNDEDDISDYFL